MASSESDQVLEDPELLKAFKDFGMGGIVKAITERLQTWKTIEINIAVTGRSGTGKSSLINALMKKDTEEEGAANTGVVETTTKVKSYSSADEDKKNLTFFDLPGVGTPNFPRYGKMPEDGYLKRPDIAFDKYDIFIIVASDRFCDDDKWLGDEIKKRDKRFIFVRTKVDSDLLNEEKSKKMFFAKNKKAAIEKTLNSIRENCKKNLGETQALFLVDSLDTTDENGEYNEFINFMINAFPAYKKDALVLAMSATTSVLIDEKQKVLTGRIKWIALASAVGGAVPLPGLSVLVDTLLIQNELKFYQSQYRIFEAFAMISALEGIPEDKVSVHLGLSEFALHLQQSNLMSILPTVGFSEFIENGASVAVPILGSTFSGAVSYGATAYMLRKILSKVTTDARKIKAFLERHQWVDK